MCRTRRGLQQLLCIILLFLLIGGEQNAAAFSCGRQRAGDLFYGEENIAAFSYKKQNAGDSFCREQNTSNALQAEETQPTFDLHAAGAVLIDGYTGRILYEKEASKVLPMASTTKIMTCIVALEQGDLEGFVEISPYAASMPDVQLNIQTGEQYRLEDLLFSLMLESHNDSAVAVAEQIGMVSLQQKENWVENLQTKWELKAWQVLQTAISKRASERSFEESKALVAVFSELMNQKAKEIGCEKTCFLTPNGLDAEQSVTTEKGAEIQKHSTTAAELAQIMRYCLSGSEYAARFREITQTRSAAFTDKEGKRSFSCSNYNRYLDLKEGAISGKTGFTSKAGYCYVGAVEQNGVYLIAALLACGWPPSKNWKWQDMNTLIDYGLEQYSCHLIRTITNPPSGYQIAVKTAEQKTEVLQKWKTEVAFEPFSILMRAGEELQESWYWDYRGTENGESVGAYQMRIGNTLCKSFAIRVCPE